MASPTQIGNYQIEAELGRGGFGIVYRAYDPTLARRIALKVPYPSFLADSKMVDRYKREARLAAGLSHPHIVTIYEIGQDANGLPYIAMELLDGAPLDTWLRQARPDLQTALQAMTGVGAALDYAHSRGIVHRDVKPANILMMPGRGAVLTDFGIARAMSGAPISVSAAVGTPAYMAPEQVQNLSITPAIDIYALGVLLYELLTGRLPFSAGTPVALAAQQVSQAPPDPRSFNSALPAAVAGLLLSALAKRPDQRPVSAERFVREISSALGMPTVLASQPPTGRRRRTLALLLALLALAAALVIVAFSTSMRKPAPPVAALATSTDLPQPTAPPTATQEPTVTAIATLPPLATQAPVLGLGANLTIEYILDASGSMLEPLGDQTKLEVARQVLGDHMRQQPPDSSLGLRAYGHRVPWAVTEKSCQDVELVAPVLPGQGERIATWLQSMQAQGMSPIGLALRQAAADFEMIPGRDNRIVLISDGKETCGIDPCQEVESLKKQGFDVAVHVIGLNLNTEARTQLSCVAKKAGGTYQDANSPQDLAVALGKVTQPVEPPPTPTIETGETNEAPPAPPKATAGASTTATRSATPITSATASPTGTAMPTSSTTATATRTATRLATRTATATRQPPTPTLRPQPPTPTAAPQPTDTPVPVPTDTPQPQPTDTPVPEPTPTKEPPPTPKSG